LQNLTLGGQLSLGTKVSLKNNATSLLAVLNALNSAIVGLGGTNNSALIASLRSFFVILPPLSFG
jgi:hypothetical protein